MNETEEVRLNIGASQTHIPGYINIDISSKADITLNLSTDRLPFEDDSVDLVFSNHTLEHIPDYLFALSEIHRVLKHHGVFLLGVPYVTLTEYNLINPYHLHQFNEFSFDFFDTEKLKGSASEGNPTSFKKIYHRFDYMRFFRHLPPPFRSWCRRHLFNVVRQIDFGLVAIKKPEEHISPKNTQATKEQYDECMRSRRPYQ